MHSGSSGTSNSSPFPPFSFAFFHRLSFLSLLRFLPVSLSLFPDILSLFFSPRKSENKYFGHVVPIVLSQMPELASYALSAPLWVIFCYLILSRCSARVPARSPSARFPRPGAAPLIFKGRRPGSPSSVVPASFAASSDPPASGNHSRQCRQRA